MDKVYECVFFFKVSFSSGSRLTVVVLMKGEPPKYFAASNKFPPSFIVYYKCLHCVINEVLSIFASSAFSFHVATDKKHNTVVTMGCYGNSVLSVMAVLLFWSQKSILHAGQKVLTFVSSSQFLLWHPYGGTSYGFPLASP